VTLVTDQGSEIRYQIVGADEIDARKGYISVDSPMSRALLGRSVDDSVDVQSPEGRSGFLILKIKYV
jgi:transcription elongation factor GreB